MTNKEKVSLNVSKDLIPDAGIGEFVEGYSSQRNPFNYKFLLWLLVPIAGQIVVVMYVLGFFLGKLLGGIENIYIYSDGFLWEKKPLIGKHEEIVVRYDEIGGIKYSKTRHYQTTYGIIRTYNGTHTTLEVCDREGFTICSRVNSYRNEHEAEDKYNAAAFATNSIIDRWNVIAADRFNKDMSEKGYGTFYTTDGKKKVTVKLGRDFIKTDNHYAGRNFKYAFQDGLLYIYPSEEDRNYSNKEEYFTINVNEMFDNRIFLIAANQLLGIK